MFAALNRAARCLLLVLQVLLREMRQRYDSVPPADDDTDIAAQLWRVSRDTGLKDDRILSEIGILFVEVRVYITRLAAGSQLVAPLPVTIIARVNWMCRTWCHASAVACIIKAACS